MSFILTANPATVELDPAPICAAWILEGTPVARSKMLAKSADRASSVVAWECSPGRFNWSYAVDETIHIISGEIVITTETGEKRRLGPGDMAFFAAGSRSEWQVVTHVRKLAVLRQAMPGPFALALRVWNKLIAIVTDDGEAGAGNLGAAPAPVSAPTPALAPINEVSASRSVSISG